MNNKCEKGLQNIDKLYAEFRKVKNVLFLRRKTRAKEEFTEVQLQSQSTFISSLYERYSKCLQRDRWNKEAQNRECCDVLTV